MNEHLNQKISQFLDNDLDHKEEMQLLKTMQISPELRRKYNRYQTISHVIKTGRVVVAKTDFKTAVSKQLQHEPVYLLPQRKLTKKVHKQLAIAASIVTVLFITGYGFKDLNEQSYTDPRLQMVQVQSAKTSNETAKAIDYPLNKQINDYLQAHNVMNIDNEQSYQPYARLSSYDNK